MTVVFWWGFWNTQLAASTEPRFAWPISIPSSMYIRDHVRMGPSSEPAGALRDSFCEDRVRIFAIGILGSGASAPTAPVDCAPPEMIFGILQVSSLGIDLDGAGLLLSGPPAPGVIVVVAFLYVTAAPVLLPANEPLAEPARARPDECRPPTSGAG